MDLTTNSSKQWSMIKDFMSEGKFSTAIKEAGTLLEDTLRTIILEYSRQLGFKQRSALNKLEEELGKGHKGIESFELGPLVQILVSKDVDFVNAASGILKKESQILKSINFGYLKELRNRYIHNLGSATRSEAQYFVSSLEIVFSVFDIDPLDYGILLSEIETLKRQNTLFQEQTGSIEQIDGLVSFYERYAQIESAMDYRDTCYYAEHDPFALTIPDLKPLYEKVHYGEAGIRKTRVILNLSNTNCYPWLLFYRFVRDYDLIVAGQIEYRGFYCFSHSSSCVLLPHTVLLYNAREMDNGYVVLSLFDNERERQQDNLIIRNKQIFRFFKSAYQGMFRSCQVINTEIVTEMYLKMYGAPATKDDLSHNIRAYFSAISGSEPEVEAACSLWVSLLGI